MKKIKITTPENIEVEYNLADMGSRTAATIIDMLIQNAIMLVLAIPLLIIFSLFQPLWNKYYGWFIGIALIVYVIISYGYFIVSEIKMNGRTIGKKLLKIRVIRNNGEPITIKHSVIRNLFKILIDLFGIGIVSIFFSKENKRLGDLAASTVVVSELNQTEPITIESLENIKEDFSYYFTKEERELLMEYYKRKDTMEEYNILKCELKSYFYNKFQALGTINEWQKFIDEL